MTPNELDNTFRELAQVLHQGHMQALGIAPTMQLAGLYNACKFASQKAWRDELYATNFENLLTENGPCTRPPIELHDGWALDTSLSLPHLDRVLEDADKIIAARRGVQKSSTGAYRCFFQNMFTMEDAYSFPSFMDFATSSDIIAIVGNYLKTIPALSTTLPQGIRLVESNAAFDDQPHLAKDSQLFHIDYYSQPNIYVLVLLTDTTLEQGPWTFLPKSLSTKVREDLDYWQPGHDYRLSDTQVYTRIHPSETLRFTYPRGSVLFIESSGCMHYGSRNAIHPRFQLMLGYTGACRTDFSEVVLPNNAYHADQTSPLLRQMVADKYMFAPGQSPHMPDHLLPEVLSQMDAAARQLGMVAALANPSV